MGNSNLETLARDFLAANKSSIPGIDKYMGILDTAEGKNLLSKLSASGGDSLKQAAEKAASGDSNATMQLVKTLLTSKEGRALASQVMEIKKNSK